VEMHDADAYAALSIAPQDGKRDSALARAGISQSTTAPWTFDEDVRVYESEGWGAMGIWLQKLERRSMSELWFPERILDSTLVDAGVTELAESDLVRSNLLGAGLFVEADEALLARRIEHALFAIETSEKLGARCVIVIPGLLNTFSRRRALDLVASTLADILERSAGSAVGLAIEPVKDVDFVTTLDEALDLVDLVNHERLGVLPDAFHLWRDVGLTESTERAASRIFGVHVADSTGIEGDPARLPPGEGAIGLGEFVAAIERTGYTGTYDVELFSMNATAGAARDLLNRCAAGMRDILPAE
jgi:sugar phosphate isomerase/epimerase